MAVVHFSKEGFEKARAQGGVMLVDFWATWCGPCKMIAPVIEQLAQQYEGRVIVGKVDVDQEPRAGAGIWGSCPFPMWSPQGRPAGRPQSRCDACKGVSGCAGWPR